jgi:glycosyltransferase involved in cell wall biosynthesis
MRVTVIIPTFNEATAIERVLDDLPRGSVEEVIVVDGGSTDGTAALAAARGARVVVQPVRGYGRACLTGLAAAQAPDVVVFLDGDYSDRPAELPRLLQPIAEDAADMVIGSRLSGAQVTGALPWHSRAGNRLASTLISHACGVRLDDLGPFRAVRYSTICALNLHEQTYGWPVEMIVKASARGYRVVQVPVSYHPRLGTSKITGTVRGSVGAAWHILGGIVKYWIAESRRKRRPGAL